MRCTHRTERLIVVEALYTEPYHLLPKPLHTLDYQTDTLRFEFPNDMQTIIALRLCRITVESVPVVSYHKKCHDCGRFLPRDRWVRTDDKSKAHGLCQDCYSQYDDPEFL